MKRQLIILNKTLYLISVRVSRSFSSQTACSRRKDGIDRHAHLHTLVRVLRFEACLRVHRPWCTDALTLPVVTRTSLEWATSTTPMLKLALRLGQKLLLPARIDPGTGLVFRGFPNTQRHRRRTHLHHLFSNGDVNSVSC